MKSLTFFAMAVAVVVAMVVVPCSFLCIEDLRQKVKHPTIVVVFEDGGEWEWTVDDGGYWSPALRCQKCRSKFVVRGLGDQTEVRNECQCGNVIESGRNRFMDSMHTSTRTAAYRIAEMERR